ncbi:MAG: hypothetical protein JSV35_03850 [Candidatus Bathyarchaeota archaeon]|nr:MAG: hypothetical protein JSV35_03850 [Candidatus Bathyarchaeota archaeon]
MSIKVRGEATCVIMIAKRQKYGKDPNPIWIDVYDMEKEDVVRMIKDAVAREEQGE